ncbi:ABC-F type ribosomal protection protein [Jeotgalibacillus sp. S-D1]|uniref:ribosomal protection-like ABC-F family protein n=1 Tax=Jeotgalibacillus sp. S-D1 TaxID=2552189 RepID=UPI00105A43E2|nr:ABC-F type ribosomal protection protein [Jeotgalibacillus sp. S-D1]TDL30690.1 ABC-F type ribosomal protection protein [Jeotgalibacillus sp. S-D1]
MIICQLNQVKKEYSDTTIFDNISFTIKENARIGLVGRNGSGKTTLFNLISGMEEPTEGNVTKQKNCQIGSLAQIPTAAGQTAGKEYLESAFRDLLAIQEKLHSIEIELTNEKNESALSRLAEEYGLLQETFAQRGGYEVESKINAVVNGLQIEHLKNRTFEQMSGGEKTKLGLALLLLQKPSLLLLDEPTNHLDLESIEWLEQFIKNYSGALVVISHDRYFLDEVVTDIADLEDGELTVYPCSYTEYLTKKEEKLMQEFHAYEEQQKKIKKMKEAIKRLRQWANEANPPNEKLFRKAKSMEKALARIERLKKPVLEAKKMNLAFDTGGRSGKDVVEFKEVSQGFEDKFLFHNVNFQVYHQDRYAIVGSNGSGKTTLLRMIVKEVLPDTGTVKIGSSCRIGYLAQHALVFKEEDRVIDLFRDEIDMSEAEARYILAKFLFYGANVFNKVSGLSGGERMRLRLAVLMHQTCNLLLLDEPTNHLDIESQEVLEEALAEFEGTILAISHDRYFLNKLFNRIGWLENGSITTYEGTFNWANEKRQQQQVKRTSESAKPDPVRNKSKKTSDQRSTISEEINEEIWLGKVEEIERELAKVERELLEEKSAEHLQQLYNQKVALESEYEKVYRLYS